VNEKIVKVFRNEKDDDDFNVGAYLEKGKVMLIDSEDTSDTSKWDLEENSY